MSQHDEADAGFDQTLTAVVHRPPTKIWTSLLITRTFATATFTFVILIPSKNDEMQKLNTVPKHACRLIDRFTNHEMYFNNWIVDNLQSGLEYTYRVVATEDPGVILLYVTRTQQQTDDDWLDPGFNVGHSGQIEMLADDVFEPLVLKMTNMKVASDSVDSATFQFEAANTLNECPSFVGIKINGTLEWRKYGGMHPVPPPDAYHDEWDGVKQGKPYINSNEELEIPVHIDLDDKTNANDVYYNTHDSRQLLNVLNTIGNIPQTAAVPVPSVYVPSLSMWGELDLKPVFWLIQSMDGMLLSSHIRSPRSDGTKGTHVDMMKAELTRWLTDHPPNVIHGQYIVDIHDESEDVMETDGEFESDSDGMDSDSTVAAP
jgi:hypothetical protein